MPADAALFRPPRPDPPTMNPVGLALLRALRTNVLGLWPAAAYEADAVVQRFFGRSLILLNAPDAIRHVLVENESGYRRARIRIRLLRPVTGNGLLVSDGPTWQHHRRIAAPLFQPRAAHVLLIRSG